LGVSSEVALGLLTDVNMTSPEYDGHSRHILG